MDSLPILRRSDLPPGAVACTYCTGRCCRYIALPTLIPTDWSDYNILRTYLLHPDISLFVDERSWYVMIFRKCENLQPDNRCGIYTNRPRICRNYSEKSCEFGDDFVYEKLFDTAEQLAEYAEALLGPNKQVVRTPAPLLSLDTPKTWDDYDDVRWYVMHNLPATVIRGAWYLVLGTAEEYRPEKMFVSEWQVAEYAEALLGPPTRTIFNFWPTGHAHPKPVAFH